MEVDAASTSSQATVERIRAAYLCEIRPPSECAIKLSAIRPREIPDGARSAPRQRTEESKASETKAPCEITRDQA